MLIKADINIKLGVFISYLKYAYSFLMLFFHIFTKPSIITSKLKLFTFLYYISYFYSKGSRDHEKVKQNDEQNILWDQLYTKQDNYKLTLFHILTQTLLYINA